MSRIENKPIVKSAAKIIAHMPALKQALVAQAFRALRKTNLDGSLAKSYL